MFRHALNRFYVMLHRIFDQSRLQWAITIGAAFVVILTLWATRMIVKQIAADERRNVRIWADAIQRKAQLVDYGREFFRQVEYAERSRVELWAEAYRRMTSMTTDAGNDFAFYSRMVNENQTIPVIVTDANRRILGCYNTGFNCSQIQYLDGPLLAEYMVNDPLRVYYGNRIHSYIFFKQSSIYVQMRAMLDELASTFFSEVVDNSIAVPVVITDASQTRVLNFGNMDEEKIITPELLRETLLEMSTHNTPIEILGRYGDSFFIFYENSTLLSRLRIFPLLVLVIVLLFLSGVILMYRISRRSEQNKLWVGMSRETAHQLGTPLSSLIAWVEYLRLKNENDPTLEEIEKDIQRLTMITDRFSKIGASPELVEQNVVEAVFRSVDYLRARLSSKIIFDINVPPSSVMNAKINSQLFGWVIENIARNAVDAIGGNHGKIQIEISETHSQLLVDIADNGKGMLKKEWERIFKAGYTTKKRGWGLGLPLCQRIIGEYHNGRIFVKTSVVGHGTTFRIILRK